MADGYNSHDVKWIKLLVITFPPRKLAVNLRVHATAENEL
jgi:hypothetical protein